MRFLAATPALMRKEGIANCAVRVEPILEPRRLTWLGRAQHMVAQGLCTSDVIAELVRTVRDFRCPEPLNTGLLRVVCEQVPNRNSRVILSDDVDEFGLRRVALDWHLSPIDKKTMRAVGISVGKYFARAEIGRVKIFDWVLAEDDQVPGLAQGEELGGYHHIGTTRMGFSMQDGVVDRDCRVFRMSNLYVAGSSVFRTGGHANPTLTIVQLTLRLADHLASA
jgi:choline dehydrogenase-like flavoprotein